MNKSSAFSTLYIILAITLIVALGLVLLKPKNSPETPTKQANDVVPNQPTTEVTQELMPEIVSCTGTYINDKYKFSMNCPEGWTVKVYEGGNTYANDGTVPLGEEDLAYFRFASVRDNLRFDILLLDKNDYSMKPKGTPDPRVAVKQLPEIIVGGIPSQRSSATTMASSTITVDTTKDDILYRFYMDEIYWDEATNAKADKVYSDFLTSFTFL